MASAARSALGAKGGSTQGALRLAGIRDTPSGQGLVRGLVAVVVPLVGTFRPPGLQHPLWSDPQVVAWRVAAGQSRRDQAG